MAIHIDIEPVKNFILGPEGSPSLVENPGFSLYWRSQGKDPFQAAMEVASYRQRGEMQSLLTSLGRISGVSIEQKLLRHLPEGFFVDNRVTFVPGNSRIIVSDANNLVINLFSIEQRGTKNYIGDFPLLSVLANCIHQICTAAIMPEVKASSFTGIRDNFLKRMLRQGSATLFFTTPVAGVVYELWQEAERRREADIKALRAYLHNAEGSPVTVERELEQRFGLNEPSSIVARYPLGTWMCQVIESAFGRGRLVELLQTPKEFISLFEQARQKFGLPEKYSLGDFR